MKVRKTGTTIIVFFFTLLLFIPFTHAQGTTQDNQISISVSMTTTMPLDVEAEVQIDNLIIDDTYFLHYNLFDLTQSNQQLIHNDSLSSSEMYGPYFIEATSENITTTIQCQTPQLNSNTTGYRLYVFIYDDEDLEIIKNREIYKI